MRLALLLIESEASMRKYMQRKKRERMEINYRKYRKTRLTKFLKKAFLSDANLIEIGGKLYRGCDYIGVDASRGLK